MRHLRNRVTLAVLSIAVVLAVLGRRSRDKHRGLATTEIVIWSLVLAALAIAVGGVLLSAVKAHATDIESITVPEFT